MRLWSLHPSLLDSKGLVALWREALLAQNVLLGKTKGYKNHPQLYRFKNSDSSIDAISTYLWGVHKEAVKREYNFDSTKIIKKLSDIKIPVTKGQLEFELEHITQKVALRTPSHLHIINELTDIPQHPVFKIVKGDLEFWEKATTSK